MGALVALVVTKLLIGLGGISGARFGTMPSEVAARWRVPIHFVWLGEHPGIGHAPLCEQGVIGSATFGGPGDGVPGFRSAWFLHGAVTDSGIGIGTAFAKARSAYGARLRRLPSNHPLNYDAAFSDLFPSGDVSLFTVESATPPRNVIVIAFLRGRVVLLGWGELQLLGGDAFTPPDGVHC